MSEEPCSRLTDEREQREPRLAVQDFFVDGGLTGPQECALISIEVLTKPCMTADTTLRMAFLDRDKDRNTKDEINDGSVWIPLAVRRPLRAMWPCPSCQIISAAGVAESYCAGT